MNNTPKESWRERFDKAFGEYWSKAPNGDVVGIPDLNKNQWINLSIDGIKSFIQSAIDEAYKEGQQDVYSGRTAYLIGYKEGVAKRDEEVLAEIKRIKALEPDEPEEKGKYPIAQGFNFVLSSLADFIRGDKKIK